MSHEYAFRAHTAPDAQKWAEVITSAAGQVTTEIPHSNPVSPSESRQVSSTISPEKQGYGEAAYLESATATSTHLTSAEKEAAQASQGISAADKAY